MTWYNGIMKQAIRISTHTPLARCDGVWDNIHDFNRQFQLTHPSRGVTTASYFSAFIQIISTHTPLARCDICIARKLCIYCLFQLTHPSRGVTDLGGIVIEFDNISTHTPLARCDNMLTVAIIDTIDFNSHTPREV